MPWAIRQSNVEGARRYGAGTVRMSKNAVRIVMDDEKDVVYEFPLSEAPENVKPGRWWITMSNDGERLFNIAPIASIAKVRFIGFAKGENQIPQPKHIVKEGKDPQTGQTYRTEYDIFTAMFRIENSEDEDEIGMVVTYTLRYYFYNNNGYVGLDKPRSKYTPILNDFLDLCGAYEKGEMPYSENILPALEERILQENRLLNALIKEGRIDSLSPVLTKKKVQEDGQAD